MTDTISQETATKLHALANHIELHGRFAYGEWAARIDLDGDAIENLDESSLSLATKLSTTCDTVGCVAGWAIDLAVTEGHALDLTNESWNAVPDVAADYLGLDYQADFIFMGGLAYKSGVITIEQHWADDVGPVEAAKMLRMLADGQVEGWEVK